MTIHLTADVSTGATVAGSATIWHLAQVREGAFIGEEVIIGRGAYVGTGVHVGARSKIQNQALLYEPATIGDGVFIGPAAVLTNDRLPRAVTPDGTQKAAADWQSVGVDVLDGASIGARAVCVAPIRVGRWSMVAAGAVVVKDVPDFALVAGVPARQIGWVGRFGARLGEVEGEPGVWVCPNTGARYIEEAPGRLVEVATDPAPAS